MADISIAEHTVIQKPKLTRKSHPKVRTGCLTCKIRRKKCDEEHPECRRCTSTGRKCDGYPANSTKVLGLPTPPSSTSSSPRAVEDLSNEEKIIEHGRDDEIEEISPFTNNSEGRDIMLQLWRPPAFALFATTRDALCFDFFRLKTGPEFSGYFDSSFWQGLLIQTCFTNSAVRQAAVALGAVHRRYELGITPEAFEYCGYAMRSYTAALKALREEIQQRNGDVLEIGLIASMLLAAFETFQGNYDTAASHMLSGLKLIFSRDLKLVCSESQRKDARLTESNLRGLFAALDVRAMELLGRPAQLTHNPKNGGSVPSVPPSFESLNDALDSLYTQVRWLFHALDHSPRADNGRIPNQQDYIIRLLQWSYAYAAHSRRARESSAIKHERPFRLLRLYREAAYLLILTHGHPDHDFDAIRCDLHTTLTLSDMIPGNPRLNRREAMDAHFSKLLIMADSLSDTPTLMSGFTPGKLHSFSVDSGILPPLFTNMNDNCVTRLSNSKVRPQTLGLLDHNHQQSLAALGTYQVAEKLTAMEDEAVQACGALPRDVDARWVDVTCFLEEKRVLMRYCTPDRKAGGLVWTQAWVTF